MVPKNGWPDRKKFCLGAFFPCMRGRLLYSANANSFYPSGENEFPLGGREKNLSSLPVPTQLPSPVIPPGKRTVDKLTPVSLAPCCFFRVSAATCVPTVTR